MKNKVLMILMALLLTSFMSVSAATITVKFDAGANGIDVSGDIPEATRGGDNILLLLQNEAGDGITASNTNSVYHDGSVSYAFDKLLMSTELPGGTYKVIVFGRDFAAPATEDFVYTNPKQVYDALKDLYLNSQDGKTVSELCDSFGRNAVALGLDTSYYDKLKDDGDGKAAFAALMKTVEYSIPADYTYSEEIAGEIAKAKEMCFYAGAAGLFADIETASDAELWYDEFYEELGFDDSEDEGAVTPLLLSQKDKAEFVSRLKAAEGTPTIEEIRTYLYDSALLTAIETGKALAVKDIFVDFASHFPELNISGFNSLSELKQGTVLGGVSEVHYDTCAQAAKDFNSKVSAAKSSGTDSSTGSSGSSSSNKGSSGGGGGIYLPSVTTQTATKTAFGDLESVPWAEDAVSYLYTKGIVNGKADGVFAPLDTVTRAEFVKMVMVAMGETAQASDTVFADVSASDWFAPYVAAAEAHGIVTGDTNGCFNPYAPISREDIATILHRTVEGGEAETELSFTDTEAVSDYAKTAVAYFAENGIINGLGDGSFGPKKNATRAEAAVMLFRLMTVTV